MSSLDWVILLLPLSLVFFMAYRSRRYIHGVADYLAAGRVCGRYVIAVSDITVGLAVVTLVSQVEANYKTGIAIGFWSGLLMPITMLFSLTGYCLYRYQRNQGTLHRTVFGNALQPFLAYLCRDAAHFFRNRLQYDRAGRFRALLHLPSGLAIPYLDFRTGNINVRDRNRYGADDGAFHHLVRRNCGPGNYRCDSGIDDLSDFHGLCVLHPDQLFMVLRNRAGNGRPSRRRELFESF